jgi:hypothetical protein
MSSDSSAHPAAIRGWRERLHSGFGEFEATPIPLILIMAIGAVLRFAPTAFGSFPLGDGGLYLAMIRAFEAGGLAIPATVTYGQAVLPYAYPPAAFWLTAVLHGLTGIDELHLMMWLPAAFATASIGAAALAARAFFESEPALTTVHSARRLACVAALIFALAPGAYRVIILGGGLTKAPGLFFVLLAIWQLLVLLRQRRARNAAALAAFGGLAALFHPDGALFLAISAAVLLVRHPSLRGAALLAGAAALAAAVCSPWWLSVLVAHGPTPLFSASGLSANPDLAALNFIAVPLLGVLIWLPLAFAAGLAVGAARRSWVLPVWLAAACLADSRNLAHDGTFIVALIGALGLLYGGRPAVEALLRLARVGGLFGHAKPGPIAVTLALAALVLAPAQALFAPISAIGPRVPLGPSDLAAFAQVKALTSPDMSAAVITGVGWGYDDISEWFPTLTGRTSVNTVQGYEWAGRDVWTAKNALSGGLQDCVRRALPLSCVNATLAYYRTEVTMLYVAGPGSETAISHGADLTASLRAALDADNVHWRLLLRTEAASVYLAATPHTRHRARESGNEAVDRQPSHEDACTEKGQVMPYGATERNHAHDERTA